MLGSLYRRLPGKRTQAAELLKRVTTMRPDDIEAWIESAELHESTDPAKALHGIAPSHIAGVLPGPLWILMPRVFPCFSFFSLLDQRTKRHGNCTAR